MGGERRARHPRPSRARARAPSEMAGMPAARPAATAAAPRRKRAGGALRCRCTRRCATRSSPCCWLSSGSTEISGGSAVRKVDDMAARTRSNRRPLTLPSLAPHLPPAASLTTFLTARLWASQYLISLNLVRGFVRGVPNCLESSSGFEPRRTCYWRMAAACACGACAGP